MGKIFQIFILSALFVSCRENVGSGDVAMASEKFDSLQVEELKRLDSINMVDQQRINRMGGYQVIKIDKDSKCNLTEGYYVLNNTNIDTADLTFLTRYLASQLFQSSKKQKDCSSPIMASSFVYASKQDYSSYAGDYLAMCTISPSNYSGDLLINTYKIKAAK